MTENGVNLVAGERHPERRHHPVERADRPTLVDDRVPIGIRLARRELAVGKVGQRGGEADVLDGTAGAVGAMTRGAGARVQRFVGRRLAPGVHRQAEQQSNQERSSVPAPGKVLARSGSPWRNRRCIRAVMHLLHVTDLADKPLTCK